MGCQGMSVPAPKGAAYVQRHDADLITRSSLMVPVDVLLGFDGHVVQGSRRGYMAAVRAIAKLTLPAGVPGTNFRVFQYKPPDGSARKRARRPSLAGRELCAGAKHRASSGSMPVRRAATCPW